MRMMIGLAVAVCAFGALSAPAFAKKPPAEPKFYGEFTASVPNQKLTEGIAKGKGEVSELRLGPFKGISCKKLTTDGVVTQERSPSFTTNVTFSGCETWIKLGEGLETRATMKLVVGFKFHANGSTKLELPRAEIEPTAVTFKGSGTKCLIELPPQEVPFKAGKNPEPEEAYEYASYETEPIELEKKKQLEEFFPATVQEKLNIFMEFKGIKTTTIPNPNCRYAKGEEGKFNKETGKVEFGGGRFEASVENIELKQGSKKGNIGFDTEKPEEPPA